MTATEIRELSLAERLLLVEEIWDSIAEETDACELTDEQQQELDSRIAAHKDNPKAGASWDEVKARIRAARGITNW